jgi:hypothetical protein
VKILSKQVTRRTFLALAAAPAPTLLDPESFRHHIDFLNSMSGEDPVTDIPDCDAWSWLAKNVPLFSCPDPAFERTYYFRWWTFRKHLKRTPHGWIITEFLKPVRHAGEFNALSCAFGHHVAEARWLHNPSYLDDNVRFWLRTGPNGGLRTNFHQFSGWAAAALYDRWLAGACTPELLAQLDALCEDYAAWERERLTPSGLFWQRDVSDGMEESISGGRRVRNIRPSINSYMYGNAKAIAAIAALAGRRDLATEYRAKAARLKSLVEQRLWNPQLQFFDTLLESGRFAGVRENIGYTPWYFDLPTPRSEHAAAWRQLMDPKGFYAPYGPTTAEQRHPGFRIAYDGDDCQWNGPSWPFATTITLRALANVLNNKPPRGIGVNDWFRTFEIYTRSHRRTLEDGREIPWIDENLHPHAGEWLARARKAAKPGFYERGRYYNHSGYCDLVITGLAGLRPRADNIVEVNPLLPAGKWSWFALDRIPYHGRLIAIRWDGKTLRIFSDGREIARAPRLARLTARL